MRVMWGRYQQFIKWYREPDQQRVVYKYRKWFWVALLALSIPTGWIFSTAFISALSIVALFIGDSSAETAAEGVVETKRQAEQGDEELDEKKVDKHP